MTTYFVSAQDRKPLIGDQHSTFNSPEPARTLALAAATTDAGRPVNLWRIEPEPHHSGYGYWYTISLAELGKLTELVNA